MKHTIVAALAVFLASPAFAQWTDAQLEVWTFVEKSWEDDAGETGEWPRGYAVEGYAGWNQNEPMPQNLGEADADVRFGDDSGSTLFYQVKPASISIDGDTAIVNYYSTVVAEDQEGERERNVSAISETLVKRNGEWRYLASSSWTPDFD